MVNHPYAPTDMVLPGFVPNSITDMEILGKFAVASVIVFSLAWFVPGLFRKITKTERLLICWFTFTGLVHFFIEGYFVFSPEFFKDKTGFYLAEVWKEYSKGDSRYAGRDAAIVALEGVTAVIEGPGALLAAYAIATRKPWSCVIQLSVSLGQLYGCFIYYVTALLEGDKFAVTPYYYWAYYIAANASWLVIPAIVTVKCWRSISNSFKLNAESKTKTL